MFKANSNYKMVETHDSNILLQEVIDYYYGNKVLIGAVSSVFVVFALFILCLWICKTYKIFCRSQSFANPNSATPQSQSSEAVSFCYILTQFLYYVFTAKSY